MRLNWSQPCDPQGRAPRVPIRSLTPIVPHAANDLATFGIAFGCDRAGVDNAQVGRLILLGVTVADTEQIFANERR